MASAQEAETLLQILAKLVAFRTITGEAGPAKACFDWVETYLASRGMHIKRQHFNGLPALVATTQATMSPKVMLQAHLDVVPGPEALYSLIEEDGRLVGRGAYDMKFAAATFMKITDELSTNLDEYDFGIMFTADEETGGKDGVKALLDNGYGAGVCVLPDGGDGWHIEIAHKGSWMVRLAGKGKSAHGSRPWEGDNAIHRLIDALYEIKQIFVEQHTDSDTLSVNKIAGGKITNQVADSAEAVLDIRFLSDESCSELQQKVGRIAKHYKLTTEDIHCIYVSKTDVTHPLVASFLQIAEQIHGKPLREFRSTGTSDAHYFAEKTIPVVQTRPDGGCAHGDEEWIDKASLEQFYEVVKTYLLKEARV